MQYSFPFNIKMIVTNVTKESVSYSLCFGAVVHPSIFPCCYWPANVDWLGLSVRAKTEVRDLVVGLSLEWPWLCAEGTSELQWLASLQLYTQVCLNVDTLSVTFWCSFALTIALACISVFHNSDLHFGVCLPQLAHRRCRDGVFSWS